MVLNHTGVQHGYKRAFDGFSGFFNWLPERYTGPLLWDFLFILGRSIDWHTSVRMVLNHPVYYYTTFKNIFHFIFAFIYLFTFITFIYIYSQYYGSRTKAHTDKSPHGHKCHTEP